MVSEIKFPEIPKVPTSPDFQPYLSQEKSPSKFDKMLNKIQALCNSEAETHSIARYITRIISSVFSIKRQLIPSTASKEVLESAKESLSTVQTVGDVLGIINAPGTIAGLIKNLKRKNVPEADKQVRKLEIFRSITSLIGTTSTVLNLFERYKVLELATITRQIGRIPVIGSGIAQVLPASVVFSMFSILGSQATIAIAAIRLKQIKERIDQATAKIKQLWNQPIDQTFAEKKIDRIITKQKDTVAKANNLKRKIGKMESTLQTKNQKYEEKKAALQKVEAEVASANKVSRFFRTFKQKQALRSAKASYKAEVKKYKQVSTEMKTLAATHKVRAEKGAKWEAIQEKFQAGTMTEKDVASLEKMRTEKVEKWKTKKVAELYNVAKQASIIAFALISIATAVTMIALTIIFPGSIPAVALIALVAIGLAIATAQLVSKLYFNRIKKRPVKSVAIPDFRALCT